nr:class I SAM-dependent methyltransferase [uncultured Sediminibacterium sp.]
MIINELPFYYKSHSTNDNGGRPMVLPFHLEFDNSLGLIYQKSTEELDEILQEVYIEGSLVDGSISSESGLHYLEPVTEFLISQTDLTVNSKILEVGFGKGYFLKELKKRGFKNLYGIEPGNHGLAEGVEDLNLFYDFYPSSKFSDKVDLIFHTLVLEHIKNPVDFLKFQKAQLNENGKIVLFVPNEEPFLLSGDCSLFIHEHFNYFTRHSLAQVAKAAGLYVERMTIIGGLLAAVFSSRKRDVIQIQENNIFNYNVFLSTIDIHLKKINIFLDTLSNKSDLAIYVPSRALNLMFLSNNSNSRLIDDNSQIQGKYLPFFDKPVEKFQDLVQKPPCAIVIFSKTFGFTIKEKCKKYSELHNTSIHLYDEISQ